LVLLLILRMTLFRDFDEEDSIDVQVKVHNETYDFKDQRFGYDTVCCY